MVSVNRQALGSALENAYTSLEAGEYALAEKLCQQAMKAQGENTSILYLLGLIAHRQSDLSGAEKYFQRALELEPKNFSCCSALAEVMAEMGRYVEAISCWQRAIRLEPEIAETYYNLANLYYLTDRPDESEKNYRLALKINPELAEAHYNLGNLLLDNRRYTEAEASFRAALSIRPEYVEAHFNLGICLMEQKNGQAAIASFETAIRLNPEMVAAYYNKGFTFHELGDLENAILNYRHALELKPDFVVAYNNLGNAYLENENPADAERCFEKAVSLKPDYADGHYNLGKIYQERLDFEAALESYRKALASNPQYSKAYNNIGKIFHDRAQLGQAVNWYQKALHIQPDYAEARFNMATSQLLMGDFKSGWEGYEWRFRRRKWQQVYPHRFEQPRWDGRRFEGKTVYVHSEQGLGDIIQFVRYLPLVKARGGRVIFETKKPMLGICRGMPSIDQVVEPDPAGRPAVECDFYIPLLSLPSVFDTDLNTIPHQVPYLSAASADIERWRPRIRQQGLRIGLVWAGTSTDPRRACPLAWFTPLTQLEDVHFYGLQKGIAAEQLEVQGIPKDMQLTNLGQEFDDFSATAAVIDQMDLVISIDTSVAHLAGAMGKPLWVLLPDVPDWRWLMNREDSPWYPTAHLFRQSRPGDWQPVIQNIADKLVALLGR